MQIKENYLFWILSIIFTCGMLYASVIKIPAIERDQEDLKIRQSVTETEYRMIKESLIRIESKIDRRTNDITH